MTKIHCQFQGGLQVLFRDQQSLDIDLQGETTVRLLIKHLEQKYVSRTPELFTIEGHNLYSKKKSWNFGPHKRLRLGTLRRIRLHNQ